MVRFLQQNCFCLLRAGYGYEYHVITIMVAHKNGVFTLSVTIHYGMFSSGGAGAGFTIWHFWKVKGAPRLKVKTF